MYNHAGSRYIYTYIYLHIALKLQIILSRTSRICSKSGRTTAMSAQPGSLALSQEEVDLITQQRTHRAATKAPPQQPPHLLPPPPAPWHPDRAYAETAGDNVFEEMLQTPPEMAPMNIYDFLMSTAINSLLLISVSNRMNERQRQEVRDIIRILRGFSFE
jgi:hypothetical protein